MYNKTQFLAIALAILTISVQGAHASGDHEGGHGDDQFAFGAPAGNAQADRTIEITAKDNMNFEPAHVEVAAGEVVRFVVHNSGKLQHSFTLGSKDWHRQHEKEMQGVPAEKLARHMKDEPNGFVVQPGETRELTWKFESSTSVRFGCHIPGHWLAGMKGRIELG